METWLVPLLSLLISAIVTTTISLLIKHNFSKYLKKKELEEQLRKEKDERLEELECANELEELRLMIVEIIEKAMEPIKSDLKIIKKGTQASLRHDLSQMADEWLKKGYCPRNVKTDFEQLYTQYHLLGQNGVMDSTFKNILELPDIKPKPKTTTKKKKSLSEVV